LRLERAPRRGFVEELYVSRVLHVEVVLKDSRVCRELHLKIMLRNSPHISTPSVLI
jgi:hypothetical protein